MITETEEYRRWVDEVGASAVEALDNIFEFGSANPTILWENARDRVKDKWYQAKSWAEVEDDLRELFRVACKNGVPEEKTTSSSMEPQNPAI